MKKLLELLNECETDEEIEEFASELIDFFSQESRDRNKNHDTIGSLVGINPCEDALNDSDIVYSINSWVGFVPKGTKIVYGSYTNSNKCCYTKGSYYYLNDESYILEFMKYLKGKDVEDIDDLVLYVHKFLRILLEKNIDYPDRDDIHRLLYKDNESFYKPVKEHNISDFYHKGSAMCTEYSVMGCNLLSLFNYDVMVIMDKEHAYNIIIDDNGVGLLLDFSDLVFVKDLNGFVLTTIPFYEEIDGFDEEYAQKIVNGGVRMEYEDYYCVAINGNLYKKSTGNMRSYGMDVELDTSKAIILK